MPGAECLRRKIPWILAKAKSPGWSAGDPPRFPSGNPASRKPARTPSAAFDRVTSRSSTLQTPNAAGQQTADADVDHDQSHFPQTDAAAGALGTEDPTFTASASENGPSSSQDPALQSDRSPLRDISNVGRGPSKEGLSHQATAGGPLRLGPLPPPDASRDCIR